MLTVRVIVKTIGSGQDSLPLASLTATETTGAGRVTVTVCVPVVTLPDASVAVYVIVVVPTGKTFPAGTPVRTSVTAPELSVAVAVPSSASVTTIDDAVPGICRVTFGGTTSTGFSVSVTVTSWVATVWLPKMSVAVQVIVVTPIGKRFPAGTPRADERGEGDVVGRGRSAERRVADEGRRLARVGRARDVRRQRQHRRLRRRASSRHACRSMTCRSSKDVVPARLIAPRPPSATAPLYENEPRTVPFSETVTAVPFSESDSL